MTKNRTLGRYSAGNARGSGYVDCKTCKPVVANVHRRLEGGKPRATTAGRKMENVNGRNTIARRLYCNRRA